MCGRTLPHALIAGQSYMLYEVVADCAQDGSDLLRYH